MKYLAWLGFFGFVFMASFIIGKNFQPDDLDEDSITEDVKESVSPGLVKKERKGNKEFKVDKTEVVAKTESKNIVEDFRRSDFYEEIKGDLEKDLSPFVYDFIALSNLDGPEIYDELDSKIEEVFSKNLENNPEKLFSSIVKGIEKLNDSPIDQANLMAHLTKIPGMEEKAKEVILSNLHQKVAPVEMKVADIKSLEDENRFFSPKPEEVAFDIKFNAVINVSEDPDEQQNITMDLFKRQKNKNIQRNIASTFLKKNPGKTNNFVNDIGIKKANQLLPANIDIEDNGNGEYTFTKLIEPKKIIEEPEKENEN